MLDNTLVFSDTQDITSSGASDNVLDTGVVNALLGDGSPLVVRIKVMETFAKLTSLTISLQTGATSTPATDVATTLAIPKASLVKGAVFEIKVPKELLRYLRLYYTVAGTTEDAGYVTAWIDIGSGGY